VLTCSFDNSRELGKSSAMACAISYPRSAIVYPGQEERKRKEEVEEGKCWTHQADDLTLGLTGRGDHYVEVRNL
jgi:hypothetical protein